MKNDSKSRVRDYYDQEAHDYTLMYQKNYHGYPASLIRMNMLNSRLKKLKIKKILDVGCGTCGPMITFLKNGFLVKGIDFSEKMIDEGKFELKKSGFNPNLIKSGDVEKPSDFPKEKFDAVIASGVFPHLLNEKKVLNNFSKILKRKGRVFIEFRNEIFSSYTLNSYSYDFFLNKLINRKILPKKLSNDVESYYKKRFDIKKYKNASKNIHFTEILAKFHNPLSIENELFDPCGFSVEKIHFYHFHVLPPIFEKNDPKLFRKLSLKLEKPDDWRGYFMASAFVVEARKN